jgi:hypothetical protein
MKTMNTTQDTAGSRLAPTASSAFVRRVRWWILRINMGIRRHILRQDAVWIGIPGTGAASCVATTFYYWPEEGVRAQLTWPDAYLDCGYRVLPGKPH